MEDSMSPERSPAPGPEQSQDPLDIGSQASVAAEEKGEQTNEDAKPEESEKSVKAAGEFKKTWGFRRTTIAKREMPGDTDSQDGRNAPVRRSGRQAKRTDKMEEFLSTAKRGRGGRRSAPAHLEASDPPSQTPTDAETASEASFDGNAETKAADDKKSPERPRARRRRAAAKPKGGSVSDNGSSENEDEDNEEAPVLKEEQTTQEAGKTGDPELQEGTEKKEEEEEEKEGEEKPAAESRPASVSPARAASRDSTPAKKKVTRPRAGRKASKDRKGDDDDDTDEDEDSSDKSDDEGYDPNALYCICRQKHNKRFMICCDRCEEWFHGDCVGITEARGRLLERNGEDYICPNCTVQKSRSTSPASASEGDKRPARKVGQNSAEQTALSSGVEDKHGEDLGIKGRIEKATNPSGKKKIKIFQPAAEAAAAAPAAVLPKCIGPGCGKNALPDSVYCGNDCILRHAAAAMKSITDVKETKPKEKPKPKGQKKPTTRSTVKKRSAGRRSTESSGQPDDDDDSDSEDEEEDEEGERKEQEPAVASWSSDHNYNAVTPEKTAPNTSSVFNKSCMYLLQVYQTPDIILFSSSLLV